MCKRATIQSVRRQFEFHPMVIMVEALAKLSDGHTVAALTCVGCSDFVPLLTVCELRTWCLSLACNLRAFAIREASASANSKFWSIAPLAEVTEAIERATTPFGHKPIVDLCERADGSGLLALRHLLAVDSRRPGPPHSPAVTRGLTALALQEAFDVLVYRGTRCMEVFTLLLADPRLDLAAAFNSAVEGASTQGHVELLRVVLSDARVEMVERRRLNGALVNASENGHLDAVELLLADARVDPSHGENRAFRYACENRRLHVVVRLLANARVDPTARDNSAIFHASRLGHLEIVRVLLEDGRADAASRGNTALLMACDSNHAGVVALLLADGRADPAAQNHFAFVVQA